MAQIEHTWHGPNAAIVDYLDPTAIERLLELSHEEYPRRFGQAFGKTIQVLFLLENQRNADSR